MPSPPALQPPRPIPCPALPLALPLALLLALSACSPAPPIETPPPAIADAGAPPRDAIDAILPPEACDSAADFERFIPTDAPLDHLRVAAHGQWLALAWTLAGAGDAVIELRDPAALAVTATVTASALLAAAGVEPAGGLAITGLWPDGARLAVEIGGHHLLLDEDLAVAAVVPGLGPGARPFGAGWIHAAEVAVDGRLHVRVTRHDADGAETGRVELPTALEAGGVAGFLSVIQPAVAPGPGGALATWTTHVDDVTTGHLAVLDDALTVTATLDDTRLTSLRAADLAADDTGWLLPGRRVDLFDDSGTLAARLDPPALRLADDAPVLPFALSEAVAPACDGFVMLARVPAVYEQYAQATGDRSHRVGDGWIRLVDAAGRPRGARRPIGDAELPPLWITTQEPSFHLARHGVGVVVAWIDARDGAPGVSLRGVSCACLAE